MKTTVIDKSKVKSFEDFKKLQWTNVSAEQKATVYASMKTINAIKAAR